MSKCGVAVATATRVGKRHTVCDVQDVGASGPMDLLLARFHIVVDYMRTVAMEPAKPLAHVVN